MRGSRVELGWEQAHVAAVPFDAHRTHTFPSPRLHIHPTSITGRVLQGAAKVPRGLPQHAPDDDLPHRDVAPQRCGRRVALHTCMTRLGGSHDAHHSLTPTPTAPPPLQCTRTAACASPSCTRRERTGTMSRSRRTSAGGPSWAWSPSSCRLSRCSRTPTTSPPPTSTRR